MRSKFNAKKTTVDGLVFDSRREAKRYVELREMERSGEISNLQRQVRYELIPAFDAGGKHYRPTSYVADFVYTDAKSGEEVVEDCKGYRTDVYRLKSKMFAHKFGVSILET
nr:MAG TPA: Endonuclease [Caudoviricetes sp.]